MKKCHLCNRSFDDDAKICAFDGSILFDPEEHGDPLVGKILRDRYRVKEKIGHGPVSDVYVGEQLQIGRKVLLKVLRSEYASDEASIRRFRQEAKLISSVNHPRLIQLFDFDQADDGRLFIVTEFLQGKSLREILQSGALEIARALRFAVQLSEGLSAAHAAGLVHRDINPECVMVVGPGDDVKIADFGFARLREADALTRVTQVGTVLGNPHYVAPEQIEGQGTDERTDIYSFGVVLYEMLCGAVPFTAATPTAIWMQHLSDDPIPPMKLRPEIPSQLDDLVLRALQKVPNQRWAKMADITAGLNHIRKDLSRQPQQKSPTTEPRQFTRFAAKRIEPSASQQTLQLTPANRPEIDKAASGSPISQTVVIENFGATQMIESFDPALPTEHTMSETMALTQAIGVLRRRTISWKRFGLIGAVLALISLASWFAFFGELTQSDQTSAPAQNVIPTQNPSPAKIVAISIDADRGELEAGTNLPLRLTVRYGDGSTKTVENTKVDWTSTNPSVATADAGGAIDAKSAGTTQVQARYAGFEAPPVTLVVKAQVAKPVAEPKLLSLVIKGGRREFTVKDRLPLRVAGKYSDGRDTEITSGIRWESSAPDIATIDANGTVVGHKEGRVNLIARHGGIASEPFSLLIKSSPGINKPDPRTTKGGQSARTTMIQERIKIARSHMDRGEYAEALNELDKASKIDPSSNEVRAAVTDTRRACNAEKKLGRADLKC